MTIKLSLPATTFLQTMLAEAGWTKSEQAATSIKRVHLAGRLLVVLEPEKELPVDDKTFSICKDCISWFVKEGRCPAGPAMNELISTFELYKE
jgi:hypothetical protein